MTSDLSAARFDELLAKHDPDGNLELQNLAPLDALDEMTDTLLELRAYCKDNKHDLLNFLIEMTICETLDVQVALKQDNPV